MVARRHHYVPQFYLKGFAVARKKTHQLVVFDCKSRKSFSASIENVAVETDFNRVEIDGRPPDIVETTMAKFETEAASALERIIVAKSIREAEDRTYLLNLIGLLSVRNPRVREKWRDFHERIAKVTMELTTATPERWASQVRQAKAAGYVSKDAETDHEKMRKFVTEGRYRINVSTGHHISVEMAGLDAILPYLFKRKWAVLKCERNSGGFVTSDYPVCLMWSDPQKRGPVGHGLLGTEIVFPICSRLALIGSFEIEEDEIAAPEHLVATVNGAVIAFSDRHVYARDYNFCYALERGEEPRKASKLTADKRAHRKEDDKED
jgi:uncharacterized protein DUF4238